MQIPPPIDYRETLEVLSSWTGREVLVMAHSQAPGVPMSHTQVTLSGTLGELQMVDNLIDPTVQSVAGFGVGDSRMNAVYLSPGDFVHTIRLSERHLNIKFAHDFHIEIQLAV